MKYLTEYQDGDVARGLVQRIRTTATRRWVLMEVCGGQTHTIVRQGIDELPIYPEQRQCAHPTTEQVLRLFSLAQRHHLLQHGRTVQVFELKLTELQRQVLALLGVPDHAF